MPINRINLQALLSPLENGATLLVPNLRIKDAILSQYLEFLNKTVAATPKIIPIDVFIEQCWNTSGRHQIKPCDELQLLSSSNEYLLWNEIIEDSLATIPLLNPDETADAVAHAYRLARQWLDEERFRSELLLNSGIADVATFAQWIGRFQEKCKELQFISLVDAITELTALLQKQQLASMPDEIVLVNFYDPPPLYENLFNALRNAKSVFTIEDKSSDQSRQQFEFESSNSEISACVNWVDWQLAQDPDAHIGIISCNKETDRPRLERALRNKLDPDSLAVNNADHAQFNSAGNSIRLVDDPLIHDALLILALGREQHDVEDLIRLLQSPLLAASEAGAQETESRYALARHLRQRAQATISSRELSYFAENKEKPYYCELLASTLVKLRTEIRKIRSTASAQDWSEFFERWLSLFEWPGKPESKSNQQALKQWQSVSTRFSASSGILANLNYSSALAKLRLLCTRSSQSNPFDARLPVSFFSIAEAAGFEFDHVWLIGLNDQQWPEPVNPTPFIPYSLQKEAQIPGSHSDIQLANARKLFSQLLSATRSSVQASFSTTDGEQEFRASSFVRNFSKSQPDSAQAQLLSDKALAQLDSLALTTITDEPVPLASENIVGGTNIISDQSSCPFRAFALHRLQAETEPTIESGLSKMARGSAIHIALEHFFNHIKSSKDLHSLAESDISEHTESASLKAVDYLVSRYPDTMTAKFQQIEQHRIANLLKEFIQKEIARPPFQVEFAEHKLSQHFDNLSLNIRIDRIDRLQGNALALVDYKTGKYPVSAKTWLDDRPEDMQLPLYHVIASSNELEPIDAVAVAHINAENVGHSGVAANANFSAEVKPIEEEKWSELNWSQTTESWKNKVKQLATEFNHGDCLVNPVDPVKTCTYCGLQSLCRIQELTANDVLADEDED